MSSTSIDICCTSCFYSFSSVYHLTTCINHIIINNAVMTLNITNYMCFCWFCNSFSSTLIYDGNWSLRSEEHTSELQSRFDLVCRLLLAKKKNIHETHRL